MGKTRIELPDVFPFATSIPVRITDINYGGHVGNDKILAIIHEARLQFLSRYGYSELNFGGKGLIMHDVAIEFKNELFYGAQVKASVAWTDFSKVSFTVYYKLETEEEGKTVSVAHARTGMVCYDYTAKKIAAIPESVLKQFRVL